MKVKLKLTKKMKDDISKVLSERYNRLGAVVAATIDGDDIEVEYEDAYDFILQRWAPEGQPYEFDTKVFTFDRSHLPKWANAAAK